MRLSADYDWGDRGKQDKEGRGGGRGRGMQSTVKRPFVIGCICFTRLVLKAVLALQRKEAHRYAPRWLWDNGSS